MEIRRKPCTPTSHLIPVLNSAGERATPRGANSPSPEAWVTEQWRRDEQQQSTPEDVASRTHAGSWSSCPRRPGRRVRRRIVELVGRQQRAGGRKQRRQRRRRQRRNR